MVFVIIDSVSVLVDTIIRLLESSENYVVDVDNDEERGGKNGSDDGQH
jgi:hypothetical protein